MFGFNSPWEIIFDMVLKQALTSSAAPAQNSVLLESGKYSADLTEFRDVYVLSANLPGVSKDNVNIEYIDNRLTISAQIELYVKRSLMGFVWYDKYIRNFSESFIVKEIDEEKIDGVFEEGTLRVMLPKKKNK